jgi:ribose transport system permease protein
MSVVSQDVQRKPRRRGLAETLMGSDTRILLVLLAVVAVLVFILVPSAREPRTIFDLLRELSPVFIGAVGMSLLMIGGEFDLSVGSMIALVTVVTITLFNATGNIWVSVGAGLLTGPIIGILIGIMVTRFGMNSLMTTLGMQFVIRGAVYVSTNKTPILNTTIPQWFISIYHGGLGPVPTPFILAAALIAIFYVISTQMDFGRHIYAVGGNPSAARVSGIKVSRVKFILFIICSTMAAIAGMLITAQIKTGYFDAGLGFELTVIAAVVLGGVSLNGGQGGLMGAVLGVLILGLTNKALRLMGAATTTQMLATGLFMMFALYLHTLRARLAVGWRKQAETARR